MKASIATVSISGALREKLPAIARAGFDGIEIFEQDFIADEGSTRQIGAMIRDHGLEMSLFRPFRDFEGLTGDPRRRASDRASYKFETMAELGASRILVCSSCHPEAPGWIDGAAADLAALGDIAWDHGIRIGCEALALGAPRQRPPRRLRDRAARRPSAARHLPTGSVSRYSTTNSAVDDAKGWRATATGRWSR